jgi:hypothetical protein
MRFILILSKGLRMRQASSFMDTPAKQPFRSLMQREPGRTDLTQVKGNEGRLAPSFGLQKSGLCTGIVQLGIDVSILLLSAPMISVTAVIISLLGAAVMNLTLAINHRPGRYIAI